MELIYLISVLLLPISLLLILLTLGNRKGNKNLPPGNTGWPIIGESLEFLSWGRKGTPDMFFSERTARYSSQVFRTSLFGERVTVVCGAEANKFLFSTESRRLAAWWPASFGKIFPTTNFGDDDGYNLHSLGKRRMISGFLKPESLKMYVAVMDAIAMQLLQNISTTTTLAAYPLAKRYTFNIACMVLLSIEDPQHIAKIFKPFSVIIAGMLSVPINLPGLPFNRAIKASQTIRKEITNIIKQRRTTLASSTSATTGKHDILFFMLTTVDETGRFMEDIEIADSILGFLIAGYDTASIACASIINYMADLPQVYEKVYQEQMEIAKSKQAGDYLTREDLQKMSYSWNVASEAMRLMPPGQVGFRKALVDLTYGGFSIPKDTKIFWSPNSTQKDPKYFPEPNKFDPTRFQGNKVIPYSYIPFGGGSRMCPGNEYARLEILVFMHNMVKAFKWEKVIPDEKIIVDPLPRLEKDLPIRLFPH